MPGEFLFPVPWVHTDLTTMLVMWTRQGEQAMGQSSCGEPDFQGFCRRGAMEKTSPITINPTLVGKPGRSCSRSFLSRPCMMSNIGTHLITQPGR